MFSAHGADFGTLVEIFEVFAGLDHYYRQRRTLEGFLPHLAAGMCPVYAVSAIYAGCGIAATVVIHKKLACAKLS